MWQWQLEGKKYIKELILENFLYPKDMNILQREVWAVEQKAMELERGEMEGNIQELYWEVPRMTIWSWFRGKPAYVEARWQRTSGNLLPNRNANESDRITDVFDFFPSRRWWWINYEEYDSRHEWN